MLVDPQALAYLLAAALVAAGGRLFQIGTKQGRALRRANRRIEHWEAYALVMRRSLRQANLTVPPYPQALRYMNPPEEVADDDHEA